MTTSRSPIKATIFTQGCVAALLFLGGALPAHAQSTMANAKAVNSLLEDYRKEFNKAKEPSDKVLRAEATKIAAKLVAAGNADAAKQISEQVEAKMEGTRVINVTPELVQLFGRYDSSVTALAKPLRDRYLRKADSLLQGAAAKDMDAVVALGEAKKVISGELPDVLSTGQAASEMVRDGSEIKRPAKGKRVLELLVEGKSWQFQTGSGTDIFTFEKQGKMRWLRAGRDATTVSENTWQAGDESIVVGNNSYELRFDDGGRYGEVVFSSTKNRYRMEPSSKSVPDRK